MKTLELAGILIVGGFIIASISIVFVAIMLRIAKFVRDNKSK